MTNLKITDIFKRFGESVVVATLITVSLVLVYLFVEPTVGHSQVYDQFTITQDITAEISFLTTANDITMSSIAGITGGVSTGTAQVVVQTNDIDGYTMTIAASGTPAMQGETQSGDIDDYTPGTANVPDYSHGVAANTAEFAYTVSASTTADLAQKFKDDGSSLCNTGSNDTNGESTCWYGLSNTATSTMNVTEETTSSGSTSTIFFKTHVNSNPSPALPQDTYTATTTLTATVN